MQYDLTSDFQRKAFLSRVDNLPTKDVKVSQEAKETVRKAKIKTIKKSK